jgi:predicted DNA-binding transcriptional regulator AlpA
MSKSLSHNGKPARAETAEVLVSAQTLAARLAVSVRTLWRLRASGKVPRPIKLGGNVRWRTEEIDDWVHAGCPNATVWEASHRREPL